MTRLLAALVLSSLSCAALAAPPVVTPVPVDVINPVLSVETSARQPVQAYVSLTTPYTVPAGKLLVIEYVSGSPSIRDGTLVESILTTTVGGVTLDHQFTLTQTYDSNGAKGYSFSQPTRLYADSGTAVRATYGYLGTGSVLGILYAISGYLIDVSQ